jgi:predicted transcriptional regulator
MEGIQRKIGRRYDTNNSTDILARRDSLEVYATMLEVAINGGIKKFQVLHEACTDPEDLKVYLQLLVQNGLLMKEALKAKEHFNCRGDDINSYYRTTNKGFVYLEFYRELERLCPSFTMCLGK